MRALHLFLAGAATLLLDREASAQRPWERHMSRAENRSACIEQCGRIHTTCREYLHHPREECTLSNTACLQRCDTLYPPAPGEAPAVGPVQVPPGGVAPGPAPGPAPRPGGARPRIIQLRRR
ncbi:MAG: hypothetical protein HY909_10400 [Deltaproteobacteria bacterium]|nr:hypothetical protein [Deltaproteobacteria bacterium]